MATNLRLSGAATGPREESDIRFNYNNLQQIICASTNLGGTQPIHFSTDGGNTWQQSSLPVSGVAADVRQGDPSIDWTSDGTAWSLTLGINATTTSFLLRAFKSVDQGQTWTFDATVAPTHLTADKEALWVDHSPTSPFKDNIYLTWHNGGPVFVALRNGPGGSWSGPQQVSGMETTGTGIGGDIKTNTFGDVFVFWHDTGSQNIFLAKSTNGGATFGAVITVAPTFGGFTLAVPAQDNRDVLIYASGAAYRTAAENLVYCCWVDLSGDSGCTSGSGPGSSVTSTCKSRIWFSRSVDGGTTWQTPFKLNDQTSLNDQIFPRLALDETSGVLMVVYYDTVNDPNRVSTDLWMQTSSDNGVSWSAALQVTTAETNETSAGAESNFQYGDYIGLTGYAGNFFACWTDRRNGALEEIWGAALTTTSISFVIDKSTYSKDEFSANPWAPAYWLQVGGFTNAELNLNNTGDLSNNPPNPVPVITVTLDPSLNPTLTAAQLATISANLPSVAQFGPVPIVPTDPTFAQNPQTFLYPYTVSFGSNAAFGALLPDQFAILTLNATLTVSQITRTASANIELIAGENPYFEDVNLLAPAAFPSWLSFDLRYFKMTVPSTGAVQTASRFNATMTTNPADATGFISQVIANLTAGNGSVGSDSFENGLSQVEDTSALEFLQQDSSGNFVFNFAVARVRLKGNTAGAQAKKVRVFFRLFAAQTTSSDFDPSTTYRFQSDGVLNGVTVPLLGVQNNEYVTIPCFATPRINLTTPTDMTAQPEDTPNAYTINVVPGVEVDSFFGCWLDVNQPQQKFLPLTTTAGNLDGPFTGTLHSINELITKAPHQCLIAEIRYDDAPIPLGANSADSDKLAQRNIAWIDGPNPGAPASRKMPHPFDISATSPKAAGLDQLMVMWGNVPAGSTATFYLPSLQAAQIVSLAQAIHHSNFLTAVDANTIQCNTGGVTFIPIPKGTARNAGLLTINLPEGIKRGEIYNVVVRQITEDTATVLPPSPPIQIAAPGAAVQPRARSFSWNRLSGAFQVTIVVSTKDLLLLKEERLLAWLLWIMKFIPVENRWYPVFQRYVSQIGGRVQGFGGDPGKILPSPTGKVPRMGHEPSGHRHNFTGKVDGLIYDRFGDFEGFVLLTEHGREHVFQASEGKIEDLIRLAWKARVLITVFAEPHDTHRPVSIILRRAPNDASHAIFLE